MDSSTDVNLIKTCSHLIFFQNPLILTNVQGSPYFKVFARFHFYFNWFYIWNSSPKVELFNIKTFHEVVDQIYYKVPTPDMILVAVIKLVFYQVDHLEPWATGSRKTAGRSKWYSPSILVLISSSPIHYIAICHHYNVVQYISLDFSLLYCNLWK